MLLHCDCTTIKHAIIYHIVISQQINHAYIYYIVISQPINHANVITL